MDLNKEIRETIEFYCGGTYENRKLAADKILQICKNKPLTIHSVVRAEPEKTCKGSLLLGTGCGKCPKCKRDRYNPPSF